MSEKISPYSPFSIVSRPPFYATHPNSLIESIFDRTHFKNSATKLTLNVAKTNSKKNDKLIATICGKDYNELDAEIIGEIERDLSPFWDGDVILRLVKDRIVVKGEMGSLLDRNVQMRMTRASSRVQGSEVKKPFVYHQPKRASFSDLYSAIQSLVLTIRADDRNSGFDVRERDKPTLDWLRECLINPSSSPATEEHTNPISNALKEREADLKGKKHKSHFLRLKQILQRHENSFNIMLSSDCKTCNVESGDPCKVESCDNITFDKHQYFNSDKIAEKIPTYNSDKKIRMARRINLEKFYTKVFTENQKYLEHALELYSGRAPRLTESRRKSNKNHFPRLPFCCPSRYSEAVSIDITDVILGIMFPLSRRKKQDKNEAAAKLYFGKTTFAPVTVQNLVFDCLKRILARFRFVRADSLSIIVESEFDTTHDRLLWEYITPNHTVSTKELEGETEFPILKIDSDSDTERDPRFNNTSKQHSILRPNSKLIISPEVYNLEKAQVLPIVSANTSIRELYTAFNLNPNIPCVMICIDSWWWKDMGDWEPSPEDEEWWITKDLFDEDELETPRTFASFLKALADAKKINISKSEVIHNRRVYGVLLRKELEELLKSNKVE